MIHLLRVLADLQQTTLLLTTEGVAGKHQGNAQALLDLRTHPTGIGVVGMDPVRTTLLAGDVEHQSIHQLVQIRPQQFLAQIAARSKRQPQNAGFGGQ